MASSNIIKNLTERNCDILEATEQYIAQQCNCTSSNYKGLSRALVERFPWATFYSQPNRQPGTITIKGDCKEQRPIIGMFAQRYVSIPKYNNDSSDMRLGWFRECLGQIAKIPEVKSLALPHGIGCGLAGGSWSSYLALIQEFAVQNPDIEVVLYAYKK